MTPFCYQRTLCWWALSGHVAVCLASHLRSPRASRQRRLWRSVTTQILLADFSLSPTQARGWAIRNEPNTLKFLLSLKLVLATSTVDSFITAQPTEFLVLPTYSGLGMMWNKCGDTLEEVNCWAQDNLVDASRKHCSIFCKEKAKNGKGFPWLFSWRYSYNLHLSCSNQYCEYETYVASETAHLITICTENVKVLHLIQYSSKPHHQQKIYWTLTCLFIEWYAPASREGIFYYTGCLYQWPLLKRTQMPLYAS